PGDRHRHAVVHPVHVRLLPAGGGLRHHGSGFDLSSTGHLQGSAVMDLGSLVSYVTFFMTIVGIYAILSLALNMQWGLTGVFNLGIAGFFAVGAYASAILTAPASS